MRNSLKPGNDAPLALRPAPLLKMAILLALATVLAACGAEPSPTPVALAPTNAPKLLATVYMSPTPNPAEQQATRLASRPTTAPPTATATATPTVYIGTFLGEAASLDDVSSIAAVVSLEATSARPAALPDRLSICPMPPDERFGTNWRTATDLVSSIGCPADIAVPYSGRAQVFERGVMYLTPDGELWAIASGGPGEGRFWYAAGAPQTNGEPGAPPPGLNPPAPRFLPYWQGLPELQDAMGWARTAERGNDFVIQLFQNGTLLLDASAGQVFILMTAGDRGPAYGPY